MPNQMEGRVASHDELNEWFVLVGKSDAEKKDGTAKKAKSKLQTQPSGSTVIASGQRSQRELDEQERLDWENFIATGALPTQQPEINQKGDQLKQTLKSKELSKRCQKKQPPDRNFLQQLNRGKIKPEREIDLHGFTVREAQSELNNFFAAAFHSRLRVVLVITGKGRDGKYANNGMGKLNQMLPQWLNNGPYSDRIQYYCYAHVKHGEKGAYYIILQRRKKRAIGLYLGS